MLARCPDRFARLLGSGRGGGQVRSESLFAHATVTLADGAVVARLVPAGTMTAAGRPAPEAMVEFYETTHPGPYTPERGYGAFMNAWTVDELDMPPALSPLIDDITVCLDAGSIQTLDNWLTANA